METERPKFLPSFLDLLRREAELSGWLSLVPYMLIGSGIAGLVFSHFMPSDFWEKAQWPVSTVVYTGLLTLNGLILVLGWNAFGRVYDTLFRGEFGAYLSEKNMANDYLVHISIMHWSQVSAVIASGGALVLVLMLGVPEVVQRSFFALTMATTIYGVKQAVDAVHVMNDLVWQAGVFENLRRKQSGAPPFSSVQGGRI